MLQHVLHALLRLGVPAQTQKRFTLQIQQILLRDVLRALQPSAAQHVCQLFPHHAIVLREVPALGRERHCHLERGVTRLAFHRDILPRHPRRPGRHTAERRRLGVRRQPFPIHGQPIAGPEETQLARVRRAPAHLAGPDPVEGAFGAAQPPQPFLAPARRRAEAPPPPAGPPPPRSPGRTRSGRRRVWRCPAAAAFPCTRRPPESAPRPSPPGPCTSPPTPARARRAAPLHNHRPAPCRTAPPLPAATRISSPCTPPGSAGSPCRFCPTRLPARPAVPSSDWRPR